MMVDFKREDIDIGWKLCEECRQGVHLLQAGFEVETFRCQRCYLYVADRSEFEANMETKNERAKTSFA